jgi:REP element-mobilizing transposase RayT
MANNESHRRRSIRLQGYDYASEGGYFITIIAHQRQPLFGEINDSKMHLNHIGKIAREEWFRTAEIRSYIELYEDEFVIMPNHLHGIIWITDLVTGAYSNTPLPLPPDITPREDRPFRSPGIGIGAIIRGYKSTVTRRINQLLNISPVPIWQRNYYEHIITTDREYEAIVEYIDDNPRNWLSDRENPIITSSHVGFANKFSFRFLKTLDSHVIIEHISYFIRGHLFSFILASTTHPCPPRRFVFDSFQQLSKP